MIGRIVIALVIAVVVGLLLVWLLGPVLAGMAVPIAVTVGDFFIKAGWILGVAAGLWYFFLGYKTWHP